MSGVCSRISAAYILQKMSLLCDSDRCSEADTTGSPRYIRMHSPVVRGLCFMFVNALLYLPAQGQLQSATPHPSILLPSPTCCPKASKFCVTEPIKACYEQKENTIRSCRIHAYIFICETRQYCVDPSAKWLPETLKKMEEMGINCTALTHAIQTPRRADLLSGIPQWHRFRGQFVGKRG